MPFTASLAPFVSHLLARRVVNKGIHLKHKGYIISSLFFVMDLEQILVSMTPYIEQKDGKFSPLCLRYRPQIMKWTFGYGNKNSFESLERHGAGDSPMDAVVDYLKKVKNYG